MALSNAYENVIVGKSYVSIIFAIVQRSRADKMTLIVEDDRFKLGDKWNNNIGELEKKLLKKLGDHYKISCLSEIHKYTNQTNTMIFLNDKMVELGVSPFSNIKELARKLPECFSKDFIDNLTQIDPERFDHEIDRFFESVLDEVTIAPGSDSKTFFKASAALEPVFERFIEYLKEDKLVTKQLHYILQALFQTILSNIASETETRYLLSSILSPRYQVDVKRLEEELMFVYKGLGGDTKKTRIQSFEIYKNRLEYLLLASFEGVIKADKVFLFGHFGKELPFEYEAGETVYKSVLATCPIQHSFTSRFKNKRIIFSPSDRMGTDFPHWEVMIDEESVMRAIYVYAAYEGAKPSFHYKKASEDLYRSLQVLFPGLNKTDWTSQISFSEGEDVWLENINRNVNPERLKIFSDLGSHCYQQGKVVRQLDYCGPLRSRFLGYFGYLLNILGRN